MALPVTNVAIPRPLLLNLFLMQRPLPTLFMGLKRSPWPGAGVQCRVRIFWRPPLDHQWCPAPGETFADCCRWASLTNIGRCTSKKCKILTLSKWLLFKWICPDLQPKIDMTNKWQNWGCFKCLDFIFTLLTKTEKKQSVYLEVKNKTEQEWSGHLWSARVWDAHWQCRPTPRCDTRRL